MMYLLNSSILFTVAYLIYVFCLKRLTFFHFNRTYLAGTLIFSLISPLITIPAEAVNNTIVPLTVLPMISFTENSISTGFNHWLVIWVIYAIGASMASLYFLWSLVMLLNKNRNVSGSRDAECYLSEGNHAYSFFGRIHIGKEHDAELRSMILYHEKVHVDELHALDLILFSIARIVFWFNPAIHLAIKEVRLNHEFLADAHSFSKYGTDYQYTLLNQALDTNVFPLANTFISQSNLKNRIKMMNKRKSKKRTLMAYGFIFPLFIGGLWMNACSQQTDLNDPRMEQLSATKNIGDGSVYSHKDEVDQPAQFVGGQEGLIAYFQDGFTYPEELKKENVEGKVMLEFIVNEDGSLSDIKALKSDDERLDAPAIAYVSDMPNWEPAQKNGQSVSMKMVLPIQYTMN